APHDGAARPRGPPREAGPGRRGGEGPRRGAPGVGGGARRRHRPLDAQAPAPRGVIREAMMADLFGDEPYQLCKMSAEISACRRYRYWLRRDWRPSGNGKTVCAVMLNPSVADAIMDDPTIRRLRGFVQAWGYSVLEVRNLFAFRATDPNALLRADDPVGPRGNEALQQATAADLLL